MVIIILFITVLLLLILSLVLYKGDFIHPGVIISEVFIISILCALYNIKTWNIQLSWDTYFVIAGGIFLFLIVSYFISIITRQLFQLHPSNEVEMQIISVPKFQHFGAIIYSLLTGVYYIREVIRISYSVGGGGTWSRTMYYYRQATSYGIDVEEGMSGIAGHMYDFMVAISYIYLFIVVNNLLVQGKKFQKSLLLPIVICCITTFLSAARIQLLYFMMAALVYYFILIYKNKLTDKINFKQLIKISLFVFVIFAGFVSLRSVIGRGLSEKSASDPLYYFTVYAGGPIPLLDEFLKNPPDPSDIFGKELFFRINRFLGGLLNNPELLYISHKEFRYASTGFSLGNVYTAFRSYIYDFGYTGLVIFTMLTSIFYSAFYTFVRFKNYTVKVYTPLIVYGYVISGVFLMSISERLFSIYFSMNTLKMIIFIYIANILLTRIKITK